MARNKYPEETVEKILDVAEIYGSMAVSMTAMLLFALQFSLLEARISLFRAEDVAGDAVPSVLDACFCILPSRSRIFN